MRTDVLKQIDDILRPLAEELQTAEKELKYGMDGFKGYLLEMEDKAICLMRSHGIRVRKVHRRPRKYISKVYGPISLNRYAIRVEGAYFHPLDFLLCPDLYFRRRRGILPSSCFCDHLLRAVSGTLSFKAGAKIDARLSAKTFWKLFQLAGSREPNSAPHAPFPVAYLHVVLDGFWFTMRGPSRNSDRQREEVKYCAIKVPGIKGLLLYTSQDAEREGLSFQDGLSRFLWNTFGDMKQIKGVVLGDGASWIKGFQEFYLPGFRFQLDCFHLRRELLACLDKGPAEALYRLLIKKDTTREAFREEFLKVLRGLEDPSRRERLVDWYRGVRRNWDHIRGFLFAEPPLRVLGSGMVEGIGGVMKQRLGGRRSWSRKGLQNITVALKMFYGWV